jgi:uncharacterized membrane protein YhaH (DUF805 family)
MSAFWEFFGFDGRLGRFGYLWRSAMAFAAIVGFAGGAILVLPAALDAAPLARITDADQVVIAIAMGAALWSGFALACRRLRDMGLEPALLVPAYVAVWVMNALVLQPLAEARPDLYGLFEDGWSIFQWAVALPLLLWPSAPAPRGVTYYYERAEPTAYVNWRESR